jgi:uncharacterized protein
MSPTVRVHTDAASFLGAASDWLMRAEAEHNLILGVAARLSTSREEVAEPPFFVTVHDARDVTGAAMLNPPFKLVLTRLPASAIEAIAETAETRHRTLPGVFGPEDAARGFAERWTRRTGGTFRTGMRQRIYRLEEVVPPPAPPPGGMRAGGADDVALAVEWMDAFNVDTGIERPDPRPQVARWTAGGDLAIWDDDGMPRSMAAVVRRTPRGSGIASVYTPPEHRGRGYATALVATLSSREVERGSAFCFLHTDLANPTSNGIYQRIGYRPVCDVVDLVFEPARD